MADLNFNYPSLPDDGTVSRLEVEIWLPLADDLRADQVALALMRDRISVSTAEPFATSIQVPHAIRVALGSVDLEALESAPGAVKRQIGG